MQQFTANITNEASHLHHQPTHLAANGPPMQVNASPGQRQQHHHHQQQQQQIELASQQQQQQNHHQQQQHHQAQQSQQQQQNQRHLQQQQQQMSAGQHNQQAQHAQSGAGGQQQQQQHGMLNRHAQQQSGGANINNNNNNNNNSTNSSQLTGHHNNHHHHHQAPGGGGGSGSLKKEPPANGKKTKGRVRIEMKFIHNKLRRYTTFSKRKTGIMKKAFELATLTGTQVMLLVASETGHVYTFATRKLQPMIISDAGKALIQTCLNSPDSDNLLMSATVAQQAAAGSGASSAASTSSAASVGGGGGGGAPGAGGSANLAAGSSSAQQLAVPHSSQLGSPSSQASPGGSTPGASSLASQHSPPGGQQRQQAGSPMQHFNAAQQQQQQNPTNAGTNQVCPSSIQSQHNMITLATNSASTVEGPAEGQTTGARAVGRRQTSGATTAATQQQNAAQQQPQTQASNTNSTTDQRMSATGFEETELSYSINDDLSDRAFNNCLPISIGTIAGGAQGGATSSASVITSPQAFEETLQSQQEAECAGSLSLQNGTSNQQQNRRQVNGHHNHQQQRGGNQQQQQQVAKAAGGRTGNSHQRTSGSFNASHNNDATSNKELTLIEQQQQQRANLHQLAASPISSQPQFNYNPLYTGLSQQQQQHFNGAGERENDKSMLVAGGEIDNQHNSMTHSHLLEDDDDMLNDIYHYSDSTESSCTRQHFHHPAGASSVSFASGTQHTTQSQSSALRSNGDSSASPVSDGSIEANTQYCDGTGAQSHASSASYSLQARKQQEISLGLFVGSNSRAQSRQQQLLQPGLSTNVNSNRQQQVSGSLPIFQTNQLAGNSNQNFAPDSALLPVSNTCNGLSTTRQVQRPGANKKTSEQQNEQANRRQRFANNSGGFLHPQAASTALPTGHFHMPHHQQQFTLTNNGQMDLAEECSGLFVEFQTNGNSPGAGLEELNSLNVTNCESLEEHINMLSHDDCFATNDLQDFGTGNTNDHFLNLFMNSSGQNLMNGTVSTIGGPSQHGNSSLNGHTGCGNQQQQQQQQQAAMVTFEHQIELSNNNTQLSMTEAKEQEANFVPAALQQIVPGQQEPETSASATGAKKSGARSRACVSAKLSSDKAQIGNKGLVPGKKQPVARKRGQANSGVGQDFQVTQNKITTTNTNRRLLPKKNNNGQQQTHEATKKMSHTNNSTSIWLASPPSTSNTSVGSALSPSSSSQFEYEAPYRQQLENLRKKLKMDVAPSPVSSLVHPSTGPKSSSSSCSSSLSVPDHHQATSKGSSDGTALASITFATGNKDLPQAATNTNQLAYQQQIGPTKGQHLIAGNEVTSGGPTTTITAANNIFLGTNAGNGNALKANGCTTTTYVIARPLEGFEAANNGVTGAGGGGGGTIYLRTPNGLVPINAERRPAGSITGSPGIQVLNLASGLATSEPTSEHYATTSTTMAPTTSTTSSINNQQVPQQQALINCPTSYQGASGRAGDQGGHQGPTVSTASVIFPTSPSEDHHQQQQHHLHHNHHHHTHHQLSTGNNCNGTNSDAIVGALHLESNQLLISNEPSSSMKGKSVVTALNNNNNINNNESSMANHQSLFAGSGAVTQNSEHVDQATADSNNDHDHNNNDNNTSNIHVNKTNNSDGGNNSGDNGSNNSRLLSYDENRHYPLDVANLNQQHQPFLTESVQLELESDMNQTKPMAPASNGINVSN